MGELGTQSSAAGRPLADKIDTLGWGAFFVWIGCAFLLDVGWSVGILGVGLVALAGQAARKYFGLTVEYFAVAMGLAMVVWGAWPFLGLHLGAVDVPDGLVSVLFIALGLVLVFRALLRRPSGKEDA